MCKFRFKQFKDGDFDVCDRKHSGGSMKIETKIYKLTIITKMKKS